MAPGSSNSFLQARKLSGYSFSCKFLLFAQLAPYSYFHSETKTPKNQRGEIYSGALHAGKLIPQSKILCAEAEDIKKA